MSATFPEGTADSQLAELTGSLSTLDARIAYIYERLPLCMGLDHRTTARAYRIACALLSLRYDVGRLSLCALKFGDTKYIEKHAGPLNNSHIGFVYECEPQAADGTYKVGFSRNPARRVATLGARLRKPLVLLSRHAGTMLDEHARHCSLRPFRVEGEGEWFRRLTHTREAA